MNTLNVCRNAGQIYLLCAKRALAISPNISSSNPNTHTQEDLEIVDPPDNLELATLNYEKRKNDPIDIKKARLLYQSRKRGMLENGILLSSFAAKYLSSMTESQIDEYDKVINLPSNDWDIFYWAMGMRPIPDEFNNSVMQMLKSHLKNHGKEMSFSQPPIEPL